MTTTSNRPYVTLLILMGWTTLAVGQEVTVLREALYSGPIDSRGGTRSAVFVDPIMAAYANGTLAAPEEGAVSGEGLRAGTLRWEKITADASGQFTGRNLRGGYFYLTYDSDKDQIMILCTNGNSEILVNGVPRAGDVYSNGWILLPVHLHQGRNAFWFKAGRGGSKRLSLSVPHKPVFLTTVDMTVPDLLTHEIGEKLAAIRIVNTTPDALQDLVLHSNVAGKTRTTPVRQSIAPMTVRKIAFALQDVASGPGPQAVQVSLYRGDALLDEIDFNIEVKDPSQPYRRTFVSEIDGSLQYYGVRQGQALPGKRPALFLSVHGAGVQGLGQAAAYQPKDWGHVIAPTNRREYGFDWEDWGRLDAMEALAHAESLYGTDPVRTYLTGHSMGGHGAWYLGAVYAARWAAIAPMAGWRSFFSYVGTREFTEPTPMEAMLNRAANPSRTMELSRNYLQHGVFIEHGDSDRTVPVREARAMREHLGGFHPDLAYYEEPGGGHWYGVDHQRVFDFFKWHQLKDVRDLEVLEFRTVCPGISAVSRYVTLFQQIEPYEVCGVVARQTIRSRGQRESDQDIRERTIKVTTENLKVFKLDLAHCRQLEKLTVEVDGQPLDGLTWSGQEALWLQRQGQAWTLREGPPDPQEKNPQRYGGFKDAFRHRMVFVCATGGSQAENDWSFGKARFDAETFYYRGNGSIEVIPDEVFTLEAFADRSVILYGNASTNRAWPLLLKDCPVQVERGVVRAGERTLSGDTWGVYMVRPRPDSLVASVGVVAGSGLPGMRAVTPNRYFVAGTGFPDLLILSPEMYRLGVDGVKAAGYFGNDWRLENGSVVWSDESH